MKNLPLTQKALDWAHLFKETWWYQEYQEAIQSENYLSLLLISNYLDYIENQQVINRLISSERLNLQVQTFKNEIDNMIVEYNSKSPIIKAIVGVSYRSDSEGKAHLYDKQCIEAISKIKVFRNYGIVVEVTNFGHGGSKTPPVKLRGKGVPGYRLDSIDLLYIPGSPFPNRTEIGVPGGNNKVLPEDIDIIAKILDGFKVKKIPKTDYKSTENQTREHFELGIIKASREMSVPIIAVCGGSWRLYQSYGGTTLQLKGDERDRHYNPGNVWETEHSLELLSPLYKNATKTEIIPKCNSTHWAKYQWDENLSQVLTPTLSDQGNTIEGFEANNYRVQGLQFHPESYLPGVNLSVTGDRVKCALSDPMNKLSHKIFQTAICRSRNFNKNVGQRQKLIYNRFQGLCNEQGRLIQKYQGQYKRQDKQNLLPMPQELEYVE